MQRVFKKIIERLEEKKSNYNAETEAFWNFREAIEIVNQVASECDGWIPVSSGVMPEERQSILAKYKGTDKWNDAMFEKISDEVNVTVVSEKGDAATTHAHTKDGKWSCDLLKVNKTYRVIAWQPLPKPYQPNICNDTDCPYNDRKECPASEGCAGYERKNTKVQTNAERIQSMSIEELAELITSGELCAICPVCKYYGTEHCYVEREDVPKNCASGIKEWLQSEGEE